MNKILDGKKIYDSEYKLIKDYLTSNNLSLTISAILIGNDKSSVSYLNSLEQNYVDLNININKVLLDKNITEDNLINKIEELNNDNNINGILLFYPLPKNFNTHKVNNTISPIKDVDCITDINIGKLYSSNYKVAPSTALAVELILKHYNIKLSGKNCLVIGRSNVVGSPSARLMTNNDATVTLAHSKTKNINDLITKADIIISAIGKANNFDSSLLNKDQVLIDCGINIFNDTIVGDFKIANNNTSTYTPVPGGVGPVTNICIVKNLLALVREDKLK